MNIRPAQISDVPAIAQVHVDSWRSTYQGMLPDVFLANLSYAQRERLCYNHLIKPMPDGITYVAETESQNIISQNAINQNTSSQNIIGFASAGPERSGDPSYRGEVYAIYLLAAYQGQGIGRQLMIATVNRLLQAGLQSLLIWVLADNPACQFYSALGGEPIAQKEEVIGGTRVIEIGYGWPDAAIVLSSQSKADG